VQERINTYDTAHKIGAVAKMPTNIYLKNNSNPVSVSVARVQVARHLCDRDSGQWQSQSHWLPASMRCNLAVCETGAVGVNEMGLPAASANN